MKLNKLQLTIAAIALTTSISANANTPLPTKGSAGAVKGKVETISINGSKAVAINTLNSSTNTWSTVSNYQSSFGTLNHSSGAETLANLPSGGVLDTLFTIGGQAGAHNATAELSFSGVTGTVLLFDHTNHDSAVSLKLINGEYIASGLTVGDTYDYKLTTTSSSPSFTAGVSVVPEPEEYALMMGGLAMLALRLRTGKKA